MTEWEPRAKQEMRLVAQTLFQVNWQVFSLVKVSRTAFPLEYSFYFWFYLNQILCKTDTEIIGMLCWRSAKVTFAIWFFFLHALQTREKCHMLVRKKYYFKIRTYNPHSWSTEVKRLHEINRIVFKIILWGEIEIGRAEMQKHPRRRLTMKCCDSTQRTSHEKKWPKQKQQNYYYQHSYGNGKFVVLWSMRKIQIPSLFSIVVSDERVKRPENSS